MTRSTASAVLQVCALTMAVAGLILFIAARRIAAQERAVVDGAERHVMRHDLDQERRDDGT